MLEDAQRSTLAAVLGALHGRRALLALDNCAHLIDACASLLETLLAECPRLSVLATSRERLAIGNETVWRVPSLAAPDADTFEGIDSYPAVRLFVERASAVLPGFALNARSAPVVAQICRRLDGIPLAIELAAARCNSLTPFELLDRLDDRFRLLTSGTRTAPTRQQTLRATVDWSFHLLDDAQRELFRGLAVFAGGWSLEAANSVCGSPAGTSWVLGDLVEKSLVQADVASATETRYYLLETLRQYAWQRLHEVDEVEATRRGHAAYFSEVAEHAASGLAGPGQIGWLRRIELEHDNMRAALSWCREHDPPAGLRLAVGIWSFWRLRGFPREGRAYLEELLALAPEDDPHVAPAPRSARADAGPRLTRREQEVVALVARGLSNREIAEHLVLSERTVEAHVTHVLNKLGVRSRVQAAVWTVEHNPLPG